jgi:4-hydroxy-2-oxoheptanedioate aldolase
LNEANEGIVIGAMIEDLEGINNLNNILEVEGIDFILVGPNDLAQGLGFPGDKHNLVVQDAINTIIDQVHAKGKLMRKDILVYTWDYSMLLSAGKEIFNAGPDTIFP